MIQDFEKFFIRIAKTTLISFIAVKILSTDIGALSMSEESWHDGRFDRLYVAILTPYKQDSYEVDEESLRNLLRYFLQPKYIQAGVGIIINPEAGEIFYLSRKEKLRNVEIAVEECGNKVPLFAGAIDLTTEDTVAVAKDAKDAGVDGIFAMPPIGSMDITTSWDPAKYPEVWIDQVKAIDQVVDMPIICHPTATPTMAYGIGLPLESTLRMCKEIPNIVGWKMAYNWEGWKRVSRGLRELDRHVGILGALALYFHEAMTCGMFDGTVTGSFNYAPDQIFDHILALRRGDVKKAIEIWNSGLGALHEYMYSEYSRLHVRYKLGAWLNGLLSNPFMRPPMPRPRKEEAITLWRLMGRAGIPLIEETVFKDFVAKLPS